MSEIYLIRHGQASFGKKEYDQLSKKGRKQAEMLAGFLTATGVRFDSFYQGEHQRHRQTLGPCRHLLKNSSQIHTSPALNEFEVKKVLQQVIPYMVEKEPAFQKNVDKMFENNRAFQFVFEKAIFQWLAEPAQFSVTSWGDFAENVQKEISRIAVIEGTKKKIAVFSSGGVIAAVIQNVLNLCDQDALKLSWQVLNASITKVKYRQNDFMLARFNEAGFLETEENMVTFR